MPVLSLLPLLRAGVLRIEGLAVDLLIVDKLVFDLFRDGLLINDLVEDLLGTEDLTDKEGFVVILLSIESLAEDLIVGLTEKENFVTGLLIDGVAGRLITGLLRVGIVDLLGIVRLYRIVSLL